MTSTVKAYISGAHNSPQKQDIIEILDPVTALFSLALIPFKESHTRFSLSGNHNLQTQEPSQYKYLGINFLGLLRGLRGDSHDDVSFIGVAIEKTAQIYPPHKEENKHIKELFDNAIAGIKAMQKSYEQKYPTTVDALEKYKDLIAKACQEDLGIKSNIEKQAQIIKRLWSKEEIEIVTSLINILNAHKKESSSGGLQNLCTLKIQNKLDELDLIIQNKDKELSEIYKM